MLYDIVGVGFGPANIALAVALEEQAPELTARFVEAQPDPHWQSGMLLDGSNTQNHPCRDLVTLRNPRSRYTFVNYLFENDRLVQHLNLPAEFPLRKEYARYVRWVADHFAQQVDFGRPVREVAVDEVDGLPCYTVTTDGGERVSGRCLVLGTGRTPFVPPVFAGLDDPRVVHLTGYLPCVQALPEPPERIVVVGGSQSAVELVLDLSKRFPASRVTNYVRSFGLRSKDHSPFSEEGYFPGFTDRYFEADRAAKDELDRYMRPTNYSASDDDVLHELYLRVYEQQLDGDQRIHVRGNREVRAAAAEADHIVLDVAERHGGPAERVEADLVVLATGFRDLGPGLQQEPYPPLLGDLAGSLPFDEHGYLRVEADYAVRPAGSAVPLYLNGLCESSHGIGDAGSFSLLALRVARILESVRKCVSGAGHGQTAV